MAKTSVVSLNGKSFGFAFSIESIATSQSGEEHQNAWLAPNDRHRYSAERYLFKAEQRPAENANGAEEFVFVLCEAGSLFAQRHECLQIIFWESIF